MEWLLLIPVAAMMLLCIPIAEKIEKSIMMEEHIHPEFYQEDPERHHRKEQEGRD